MMRLSKFTLLALLAGLYFLPMQAVAGPAYRLLGRRDF